ncbi:pentatricopeptide repeat 336 [Carex rostrata]
MAITSRIRLHLLLPRHLSTSTSTSPSAILNPSDPSTPLTSKQKSRAALSLLKKTTDPDQIVKICRAAALSPTNHLDRSAFSMAVNRLSSSQSIKPLRSLISSLLLPYYPPHAIVLFGQGGLLEDAISTFKSHPSTPSLNSLLLACIISKRHSEIPRIYSEFPKSYNVTPDLDTYHTVIKSFCESGTSRSFYSMLDEMLQRGVKPNRAIFSTALSGFYKEEKFDDVKTVLQLMTKHKCGPGLTVYNVMIQSLCKLKRVSEAKELFEEMNRKGLKPNWVSYNHLIHGFCKEGDLEEVKRLYKEMGAKGFVGDSKFYFTVIYFLCKSGECDMAYEVYKKIENKNWVPCFSTMKMLVTGLASNSRVEDAKEIIEKMKEKFSSNSEVWKEVEDALP